MHLCVSFVSIYIQLSICLIRGEEPTWVFFSIDHSQKAKGTMNGVMGSECSSGCESGWTLYLEHSFLSHKGNGYVDERGVFSTDQEKKAKDEQEEEEEDLSMVSDASSGPPHYFHDQDEDNYNGNYYNNGCFYNNPPIDHHSTLPNNTGSGRSTRHKIIKQDRRRKAHIQEQPSFLDDTASSSIFNFSHNNFTLNNNQAENNILEFSQGHSATHIEGRSAFHGHFGFFQSPLSGNQQQQNQWFEGKR